MIHAVRYPDRFEPILQKVVERLRIFGEHLLCDVHIVAVAQVGSGAAVHIGIADLISAALVLFLPSRRSPDDEVGRLKLDRCVHPADDSGLHIRLNIFLDELFGQVQSVRKAAVGQSVLQAQHRRDLDFDAVAVCDLQVGSFPFRIAPFSVISIRIHLIGIGGIVLIIFVLFVNRIVEIQGILLVGDLIKGNTHAVFADVGGIRVADVAAAQVEQTEEILLRNKAKLRQKQVGHVVVSADDDDCLVRFLREITSLVDNIVLRKNEVGIPFGIEIAGSTGHRADDRAEVIDEIRQLRILLLLLTQHVDIVLLERRKGHIMRAFRIRAVLDVDRGEQVIHEFHARIEFDRIKQVCGHRLDIIEVSVLRNIVGNGHVLRDLREEGIDVYLVVQFGQIGHIPRRSKTGHDRRGVERRFGNFQRIVGEHILLRLVDIA